MIKDNLMQRFSAGQVIPFFMGDIEIIRKLGVGFTSVVYEGILRPVKSNTTEHVAVKVLHDNENLEMIRAFRTEGDTLNLLMNLENQKDDYTGKTLKVAPLYYGMDSYQDYRYIVMEFIEGEDIATILKQKGRLSEKQVLSLATQFFRLLEILHDKLNKTFTDLKLDDLWWIGDEDGYLKVIDLGLLQDINREASYIGNPRIDLIIANSILFLLSSGTYLLMGVTDLKEVAEPIIESTDLSWGLREVFKKALSRNPQFRYASATELKQVFFDLYQYWTLDFETLFEEAKKAYQEYQRISSRENEIESARASIFQAQSILSILEKRKPETLPREYRDICQNVKEAIQASSYLEQGKELVRGGAYKAAFEQLSLGESISYHQTEIRRWKYVAMIGGELSTSQFTSNIKDKIIASVERMKTGDDYAVKDRLAELKETIPSKGLECLIAENEALIDLKKVDQLKLQRNYGEAARILRNLQNKLKFLPKEAASFIAEIGDIGILAEDYESLSRTYSHAQQLIQDARQYINELQWDSAIASIENAWINYPDKSLFNSVLEEAILSAQQKQEWDRAQSFANLAQFITIDDTNLQTLCEGIRLFSKIRRAFVVNEVDYAIEIAKYVCASQEMYPKLKGSIKEIFQENILKWYKIEDINRLTVFLDFIEQFYPQEISWHQEVNEQIRNLRNLYIKNIQNQIDEILKTVKLRLFLVDSEYLDEATQRLSFAKLLDLYREKDKEMQNLYDTLQNIKSLASEVEYNIDEIDHYILEVHDFQHIINGSVLEVESKLAEAEHRIKEFQERYGQIQELYNIWRDMLSKGINPQLQIQIRNEVLLLCEDLFTDVNSFCLLFGDDPQNEKIRKELLVFFEFLDGWSEWIKYAQDKQHAKEQKIDEITAFIRNGELEKAISLLEILDETYHDQERLPELRKGLLELKRFQDWEVDNSTTFSKKVFDRSLLDQIERSYQKIEYLPLYWQKTRSAQYINELETNLFEQLMSKIKNPSSKEYFETLYNRLYLQKVNNKIRH
jgi:hypothetical protein